MPLGVNKEVRDWLRAAIIGGSSNDTTLRLKGDLKRFPFADGSGIFEVRGKFHGATLRYAPSWPQIDNITGELEFVGRRMTDQGQPRQHLRGRGQRGQGPDRRPRSAR